MCKVQRLLLLQATTGDQQAGDAIDSNPDPQGTTHLPEALQKVPNPSFGSSHKDCISNPYLHVQADLSMNARISPGTVPYCLHLAIEACHLLTLLDPDLESSTADPHHMQLQARHMACNSQQGGVPGNQLPYLWRQGRNSPLHGSFRRTGLHHARRSVSTLILEKRFQGRPTRYAPLAGPKR